MMGTAIAGNGPTPIPTSDWHDFYGYINNSYAGGIVTAKDPQGVVCGEYIIENPGQYGFMHVYGDDPYTPGTDEGAQSGDAITFYYNSSRVPQNAAWTGGRARTRLDLTIGSGLRGDVNGDCKVNIFDLAKVGLCYGCQEGQPCWGSCQQADIYPSEGDGTINIFDLATVGLNYGGTC